MTKTNLLFLDLTRQIDNVGRQFKQTERHEMSTRNRSVSPVCVGNCW
jgi:hypothetical protein